MFWKTRRPALFLTALLALAVALPLRAADPDTEMLKAAKVGTEPAELTAFLRKQVLSDKDREQIEGLVRQLGAERFAEREDAADRLVALGPAVAPFLREAANGPHPEVGQRARQCLTAV